MLPIGAAAQRTPCFYPEGAVDGGFVTAEVLLSFGERGQADYTVGVLDTLFFSNELENEDQCAIGLRDCSRRFGPDGLLVLIDASLRSRPDDWRKPAPIAITEAINEICQLSELR